jgi:cell division protein FtsW
VLTRLGAPQLMAFAALMVCGGLVAVFSASHVPGDAARSGSEHLVHQLWGVGAGGAALIALLAARPSWIRGSGYLAWALAVLALALTLGPLGIERNNAQRWLDVGPFALQPLELAKIGLVLGLAQWFARHEERIADVRLSILVPAMLIAVPAALLLRQPDFGGTVMLVAIGGLMVFLAGARASHLAFVAALVLPVLAFEAAAYPYRVKRLEVMLDPGADPLGAGYQLSQSVLAFKLGGWCGCGLGSSLQKLYHLPEPHTDFILAIIGEELGLCGVIAVLIGFTGIALASLGVASRARDLHGSLLAAGAGALLWLQAAVNAGVVLGLLPTKGTTLPLFSYGNSALVGSLAALGLVLHVARPSDRTRGGWR